MYSALLNGKIYQGQCRFCEALLIRDGLVAACGSNEEIRLAMPAGTRVIDAGGRLVLPGLNDSHMHISHVAHNLAQAPIIGVRSIEDLIARCRKFREENPDLTAGGMLANGWNQDLFTEGEKRMPNRHDLDRIATDIPIVLSRICGHSAAANTKAIEMAGLGRDSGEIEGGTYGREADGFPDGFFTENAIDVVRNVIPRLNKEQYGIYILKAMKYAASRGLTSIQSNDVGSVPLSSADILDTIYALYQSGDAPLRYHAQTCFDDPAEFRRFILEERQAPRYMGFPDRFTFGPLKMFRDGSIGSRTALMRDGYLDDPTAGQGVGVMSKELMDGLLAVAAEYGIQAATHTIGDQALVDVLDCYEKVMPAPGQNPLRHSIVHFQCMDLPLLKRTADMSVIAQVQPIFLAADIGAVATRFTPELNRYFLAFKTDLANGIPLSFGTDSPVEDCNPFPCLYSAVTRQTPDGLPAGGFFPEERLDPQTAVDCYTAGSAYAEFKESVKGLLLPGYYADLTICDRDILTCEPSAIYEASPVLTMMGGQVTFEK